ncbi:MAG TPA: transposase [Desulfobacteraceae bacterium]|nr:transposase [Desulfobacteraceae bacterium]
MPGITRVLEVLASLPDSVSPTGEGGCPYDRKLLAKLSICAWKVINAYLKSVVSDENAVPGASITVQTYGDFLNFNPHLHAIVTDGCFLDDGNFKTAPVFILEDLETIFQYEVFKMLKTEGKINYAVIENMLPWYQSGFHVYMGDRITPSNTTGLTTRTLKRRPWMPLRASGRESDQFKTSGWQ